MQDAFKHSPYMASCGEFYEWLTREMPKETAFSHRVLALLAAAKLDTELEEYIKVKFSRNPRGEDTLFGSDRPLSTFSAKINLAHRLGLIDDAFRHALDLIRKIRNDCAHATEPIDFRQPPHKDRIGEITRIASSHHLWQMAHSMMNPNRPDESKQFEAAFVVMTITILCLRHNERPFQPSHFASFERESLNASTS